MILNIYKEKDWTSFDVVAKLRGILKTKKIGHAGTLDPLAQGVVIVLTESDTKKQDEYMHLEKEYKALIAFGATSDTYDLEGALEYHELPHDFDLEQELEVKLDSYIGNIAQKVPPYSAVKVKGKALYKYARAGKDTSEITPTKQVHISSIIVESYFKSDIGNVELPCVELTIVCSKGTYIRSLAHDLGNDIGVGAVLINLIRTRVGSFEIKDSLKVEEIQNQFNN